MKVSIKVIDECACLPEYQTPGSAGLDLVSTSDTKLILPQQSVMLSTGISVHIDNRGYAGLILPRSGKAHKEGLTVSNSPGLLDSDYTGELFVCLRNTGREDQTVQKGDRIAQLVIVPIQLVQWEIVDQHHTTSRGENGFGSTGGGF